MTLRCLLAVPDALVALDLSEALLETFGSIDICHLSAHAALEAAEVALPAYDIAFVQTESDARRSAETALRLSRHIPGVVLINGATHIPAGEPYFVLDRPFTNEALRSMLEKVRLRLMTGVPVAGR